MRLIENLVAVLGSLRAILGNPPAAHVATMIRRPRDVWYLALQVKFMITIQSCHTMPHATQAMVMPCNAEDEEHDLGDELDRQNSAQSLDAVMLVPCSYGEMCEHV